MNEPRLSKSRCPACGYRTISNPGSFEICPVCYWEDEGAIADPDEATGGPNGELSLSQARKNIREYGAVEVKFIGKVRKPQPDEE